MNFAAAATFYPYRTAVLADAPSFFWRVGEAGGTAIDDAGTCSRDGTHGRRPSAPCRACHTQVI